MKKLKYLLFLLLLLIPIKAYAADNADYQITDFFIEAKVNSNGDMEVKELIILNGRFNGYERDIRFSNTSRPFTGNNKDFFQSDIYNASDISNINIYSVDTNRNIDFDLINSPKEEFTKVNKAKTGDSYKYIESSIDGGKRFKMYQESNGGYKGFLITYTLEDIVVVHNDIAELYWSFIGTDFIDHIGNVELRVSLPEDTSDLRVWAHGPQTGNVSKHSNKEMIITIESLPANNAIDGRMTFDKALVNLATKTSNLDAFDKILEVENNFALYANQIREEARAAFKLKQDKYKPFIYGGVILWFVGLIILIIYVYLKHDREYKKKFEVDYYRDFPAEYGPEVLDYLIHQKITNNSLTASLLEIIRKKGLLVEKIEGTKKDYKFINNIENAKEPLTEIEEYIREWFIVNIGNGTEVTNNDIEKTSKSLNSSESFMKSYNSWKNKASILGEKKNFFESKTKIRVLGVLLSLILIIPLIIGTMVELYFGCFFLPFMIFSVFYFICFTRRTPKGNEEYIKWMAFKKFLKDFGRFSDKELPEIYLWEKYLVYATVLGVADKIEEVMKVRISQLSESDMVDDLTFLYFYHLGFNYSFANTINHTVSNTVTSSISAIAASSNSSGAGFGGGFSSGGGSFGGGGFGGGGGGGRGF